MDCTVGIVSQNLASTSNFVEFRDSRNLHVFRGIAFRCRKMIFDVTKVTYNMHSCAISGMSRERMKMDGRDSAECQNWEQKDKMVILEFFKLEKDKTCIVLSLTNEIQGKKK